MCSLLLNSQDGLFVEDDYMDIEDLREAAKEFIDNFGKDPLSSDNPNKAVISLQNDRGTSYEMFIAVQNELTAAYNELRDEEAMRIHGVLYDEFVQGRQERDPKEVSDEDIGGRTCKSGRMRFKEKGKAERLPSRPPPCQTSFSCFCSSSW